MITPTYKKLLLASTNPGKLREISKLLGKDFKVISLSDIFEKIPDYEESGMTFKDNAEGKALFYNKITGIPTIADDSGLSVASLNGAPGVLSARWAGENALDEDRINKLLREMDKVPDGKRQAQFICCAAFANEGAIKKTVTGNVDGMILFQPKGTSGFGYDPVFYYSPLKKTFAEMKTAEKNEHSHRGIAFRELADYINKKYI